jgi:hypothetical protein
MWIPAVISIIIEIIKLIIALRKKGETVSACTVALKDARKKGDMTRLEAILARLREGKDCD